MKVLSIPLDDDTYWDFCRFKLESRSRNSAEALSKLLKLTEGVLTVDGEHNNRIWERQDHD